jgi:hypothetical protein
MKIDKRGLIDDGQASLIVEGPVTVTGVVSASGQISVSSLETSYMVRKVTVLPSASNTIAVPGYFRYKGGSVIIPSAASYPGAMLSFAPVIASNSSNDFFGAGLFLTGTAVIGSAVFVTNSSGSLDASAGTALKGSKLTLAASGSVILISDSNYWLRMANSGTLTFSA